VLSGSNSALANLDTTSSLKFGHRGNPTDTPGSTDTRDFYLNGSLDEVSLYNRALTAGELLAIYNAGVSGKCLSALPPAIAGQPQNLRVGLGGSVTFNVSATGAEPLKYQWRFAGTNLASASSTSLTLNNIQLSNAGFYDVIVTNQFGIATSTPA